MHKGGKTDTLGDLPQEVEITPDLRIPLPDGRSLSARLWLPKGAREKPVPALVEYCPFRHADFSYPRDALIHPWFAGHGYASLRLEPAGSLDSDGPPQDEYVAQEQKDGADALAWIAAQDWCSGATGLFGMSWGAFSALQVASLRPPSLKAIIPVHGSDDRFRDDIHYMGGTMLTAGLAWGALYQTYSMRPPSREAAGDAWRDVWRRRIEAGPNILKRWMSHQTRDAFWRHGSLAEDYARIEVPTLLLCGWADGYSNAALRMMMRLAAPVRAIVGPWTHAYPHLACPGPQMDFLGLAKDWWDRWLLGQPNGVEAGPKLRYYLQHRVPPRSSYSYRPGRWYAAQSWPPEGSSPDRMWLNAGALGHVAVPGERLRMQTPLSNDMRIWEWLPHGVGPEMPGDQADQDQGALVFDGPVLERPLRLAGAPRVKLRLWPSGPTGNLLIRLSSFSSEGQSTLLTYGLINLTTAIDPETNAGPLDLDIRLNDMAEEVPAGFRLRLSISTECWPLAWPAPERLTIAMDAGTGTVDLPVLHAGQACADAELPAPAIVPQGADITWLRSPGRNLTVQFSDDGTEVVRRADRDDGAYRIEENARSVDARGVHSFFSREGDPLSARAEFDHVLRIGEGNQTAVVCSHVAVSADMESFNVQLQLNASDGTESVFSGNLSFSVPRDVC